MGQAGCAHVLWVPATLQGSGAGSCLSVPPFTSWHFSNTGISLGAGRPSVDCASGSPWGPSSPGRGGAGEGSQSGGLLANS